MRVHVDKAVASRCRVHLFDLERFTSSNPLLHAAL